MTINCKDGPSNDVLARGGQSRRAIREGAYGEEGQIVLSHIVYPSNLPSE